MSAQGDGHGAGMVVAPVFATARYSRCVQAGDRLVVLSDYFEVAVGFHPSGNGADDAIGEHPVVRPSFMGVKKLASLPNAVSSPLSHSALHSSSWEAGVLASITRAFALSFGHENDRGSMIAAINNRREAIDSYCVNRMAKEIVFDTHLRTSERAITIDSLVQAALRRRSQEASCLQPWRTNEKCIIESTSTRVKNP